MNRCDSPLPEAPPASAGEGGEGGGGGASPDGDADDAGAGGGRRRAARGRRRGGGLDALRFQWNHDAFGASKLRRYLPPRVYDVVRLHSLREVPFGVYSDPAKGLPAFNNYSGMPTVPHDTYRGEVLRHEAEAFKGWLERDPREVRRLSFVAHFQWFDALSKVNTDEIPPANLKEIDALLGEYFPGGEIDW